MIVHTLELKGVGKTFRRVKVLESVDLQLAAGVVCGIVGPNGAGKTTLLRVIAGLLHAAEGEVRILGRRPRAAPAGTIAYFAGESSLPPSVRVTSWRRLFGHDAAEEDRRPFRRLSRGTRQQIGLEVTLARPAAVLLLLDEPWEGLDPDASRWLSRELAQKRLAGVTVVVSSHRLHDLAGLCDTYGFLVARRLVELQARDIAHEAAVTGNDLLRTFDRLRREARNGAG